MGAGAVGCFFGSKLAMAGHDVHFIARGEHLTAIQNRGLKVKSVAGEWRLKAMATDQPETVGPVDLVLVCVKNYDLEKAAQEMAPLIGPDTCIIPLQNGVDAPDYLNILYGKASLGGSCHIEAFVTEPGVISHTSKFSYLTFGELDGRLTPRAEQIQKVMEDSGINVRLSDDIRRSLWEKVIYLCTLSGLTTITQLPIGPLREDPETWSTLTNLVQELVLIGRTDGVNLVPNQEDVTLERFQTLHEGMRSSMLRDRERGRRLEVEAIQGSMVRRSRRYALFTPVLDTVYSLLRPLAGGGAAYNQVRAQMVAASNHGD